jgi:hypothetical protein
MYIECKAGGLTGSARIGRVTFSKTGRTLYYRGRKFQSLKGAGFKSNYYDLESGEDYWISGPKRDGSDRLYGGRSQIEIDNDVREEYWREIRHLPARVDDKTANHAHSLDAANAVLQSKMGGVMLASMKPEDSTPAAEPFGDHAQTG